MKRGTVDHPKTCALAAVLGIPRYAAVGILESLWHFTAQYAPRGDVGRWNDAAICHAIAWEREPAVLLEALLDAGWLEHHPQHRLIIHDWDDHMSNGVRAYLRHHGVKAIVSRVAEPRLSISSANAEQARGKGQRKGSFSVLSSPDPETEDPTRSAFAQFWAAYPRRVGKQDAWDAWVKLRPPLDTILAALAWQHDQPRWLEDNRRYVPHPTTYLNHRRWEDERPLPLRAGTTARTSGNLEAIAAGLEAMKRHDRR
jgi:hypothetical protein